MPPKICARPGPYVDGASAATAALENVSTCKLARITGPDGLFAEWIDGAFASGNLREAAEGPPVPPPRHKINLVFKILRREYQRDRKVRSILLYLAQNRTKAKLTL